MILMPDKNNERTENEDGSGFSRRLEDLGTHGNSPIKTGTPEEEQIEERSPESNVQTPRSQETETSEEAPRSHETKISEETPSREFGSSLKGALSFLTIFKIDAGEKEINAFNRNLYVAPVVGLILGLIASLVGAIFFGLRLTPMIGIAIIATVYIMSKFLHFDGLVDFGDGMISSGDREGKIKALKDTRIGAGGLGVALITVIAILVGINSIPLIFTLGAVIVIMEVFAKNAMVAAAAFGEPGEGMAGEQVRSTSMNTLMVSTIISIIVAFVGYLLMGTVVSLLITGAMPNGAVTITIVMIIVGAAAVSAGIGWLIAHLSNKKFGFVNGDVLGATNEISKIFILMVALIIITFYLM